MDKAQAKPTCFLPRLSPAGSSETSPHSGRQAKPSPCLSQIQTTVSPGQSPGTQLSPCSLLKSPPGKLEGLRATRLHSQHATGGGIWLEGSPEEKKMPGSETFPGKRPQHQDLEQGDSWPPRYSQFCSIFVGLMEEMGQGTREEGDKEWKETNTDSFDGLGQGDSDPS